MLQLLGHMITLLLGATIRGLNLNLKLFLRLLITKKNLCIPNLTLSLSSISTYDQYQWYYNGELISGANQNNYTPTQAGYYQISGFLDGCEGTLLSNNIPVSACPEDYDNDGVNDNIDVDNDNDGLLDCFESLGNKEINLTDPVGGNIEDYIIILLIFQTLMLKIQIGLEMKLVIGKLLHPHHIPTPKILSKMVIFLFPQHLIMKLV